MDTATVKNLTECIRQLSQDLKRLRACDQILHGHARLNSSGDGLAMAIVELQAAADEVVRHSRQLTKAVTDLSSAVNTTSTPATQEMQQ
jgi:hypothetical protein